MRRGDFNPGPGCYTADTSMVPAASRLQHQRLLASSLAWASVGAPVTRLASAACYPLFVYLSLLRTAIALPVLVARLTLAVYQSLWLQVILTLGLVIDPRLAPCSTLLQALDQVLMRFRRRAKRILDGEVASGTPRPAVRAAPTSAQVQRASLVIQSAERGRQARQSTRVHRRRHRIASEMLSSETVYITSLLQLQESFLVPLRTTGILSTGEIREIFQHLEIILAYNQQLQKQLKKRLDNWHVEQKVGDVFAEITPFLKTYTAYVNNFEDACSRIGQLRAARSSFARFLDRAETRSDGRIQTLDSYLILPIQRLPRYCLLLQDLLKNTTADHPDHDDLVKALVAVTEVACYVNSRKADAANIRELLRVQGMLLGRGVEDLCQPHRRFVREGPVMMAGKTKHWFLFNDCLVVAHKQRSLLGRSESYAVEEVLLMPGLGSVYLDTEDDKERTIRVGDMAIRTQSSFDSFEWIRVLRQTKQEVAHKLTSFSSVQSLASLTLRRRESRANSNVSSQGGEIDTSIYTLERM